MNKTIVKTYKPQMTKHPIWMQSNRVVYRHYEFDVSKEHKANRQLHGTPTLLWKHEDKPSDNTMRCSAEHEFYNGCSYMWGGYNPTPVTGWFHGVPLKQMFKWCEEHGLTNPKLVSEYVEITFEDTSNDNTIF